MSAVKLAYDCVATATAGVAAAGSVEPRKAESAVVGDEIKLHRFNEMRFSFLFYLIVLFVLA